MAVQLAVHRPSPSVRPSTRSRPATRRRSFARAWARAGLAEAAIGDQRQVVRGDAGAEHDIHPLGDIVRGLDPRVLDIDHAGGDMAAGGRDLAQDLDLGHLPVRELEHELVDAEAEHRPRTGRYVRFASGRRGSCRSTGGRRAGRRDRRDGVVEQRREVGRRVGWIAVTARRSG
jgi:hypothetical protein